MKYPFQLSQKLKSAEKKVPAPVLIIIAVIVSLFFVSYILFNQYIHKQIEAFNITRTSAELKYFGYIQPQVIDGFSEEPLGGAFVVIPETGQKFITDSDGLTAVIKVPMEDDVHFSEIHPKSWSEITLIIYKEGYIEYALFQAHVWENQTRQGPVILLFPKVEGESNDPFSIVEGPHRIWVRDLVDKFRPDK